MRQVTLPKTLSDLWSCLDEDSGAVVFSGGTDLFVKMRAGGMDAAKLIGLERIAELKTIEEDDSGIRIGAGATLAELLRHPLINTHLPILAQALQKLGSPPIRNMGTIGGNICTASPAGDTLPPLYTLRAEVEIGSLDSVRTLPIHEFVVGPGQTQLKKGEIVTAVRMKKPEGYNIHHFEKIGHRKSMCCAVASMAALLRVSTSGVVETVRLAWGSVGPTVMTVAEIENSLVGKQLSRATLARAAEQVRQMVSPIDDVRASADYRRTVSGNLLLRLVNIPSRNGMRP